MAEITTQTNTPEQIQTPAGSTSSDFMTKVQEQLLGQSQMVSSTTGSLEQKIQDAITSTQKGTEASKSAIQSAYDRQLSYDTQTAQESLTAGRAAGSGGIMNIGALRELTRTTDQHLKDLEQRKQELMLQADAAGYKQVSDLQIKALEFKQQAEQQVFANLLGMANFGMQAKQEDRLARAQSFQEQQTIASTALEYGLTVQPGETLDSIVTRAMPIASKQKRLELAKLQSDINQANAQAEKYRREGISSSSAFTDPLSLDSMANAYNSVGATIFTSDTTPAQRAAVINRAATLSQQNLLGEIQSKIDSNQSKDSILKEIQSGKLSATDQALAMSYLNENYVSKPKSQVTQSAISGQKIIQKSVAGTVGAVSPVLGMAIEKMNIDSPEFKKLSESQKKVARFLIQQQRNQFAK